MKNRMVVGISGASGAIFGIRMLQALREADFETHLVISRTGTRTIVEETDHTVEAVRELADVCYSASDVGAAIASGSFRTRGMIIAPCSIKSAAEIAHGVTDTLLARAADVVLKERRRLVLMVRESPLHLGHLRTLTQVTEAGAIIAPPVPAFYIRPRSIEDLIDHAVGRVLDLFDIDTPLVRRWAGTSDKSRRP